jgi:DNA-directed RNA polymerase subunit RPC12/RpoP
MTNLYHEREFEKSNICSVCKSRFPQYHSDLIYENGKYICKDCKKSILDKER